MRKSTILQFGALALAATITGCGGSSNHEDAGTHTGADMALGGDLAVAGNDL